jgi:hypothetical protein
MSLMTALLAFVPALGVKAAPEPEPDRNAELLEHRGALLLAALEERDRGRHEISAMAIEIAALRRENDAVLAMVRERDRVIAGLNGRISALRGGWGGPEEQWVYGQQLANRFGENHNLLLAQAGQQLAQLNALQTEYQRTCTCVPGRADALRVPNG